jgi:hypothetical protein
MDQKRTKEGGLRRDKWRQEGRSHLKKKSMQPAIPSDVGQHFHDHVIHVGGVNFIVQEEVDVEIDDFVGCGFPHKLENR